VYTLEFPIDTFSGQLAGREEKFFKVGRSRVRIRELEDRFWSSPLETRRWFQAKSRDPFLIIVVTRASGQNAHLDGRIQILAPDGCHIHHGEGKQKDVVTSEETAYLFSTNIAELQHISPTSLPGFQKTRGLYCRSPKGATSVCDGRDAIGKPERQGKPRRSFNCQFYFIRQQRINYKIEHPALILP